MCRLQVLLYCNFWSTSMLNVAINCVEFVSNDTIIYITNREPFLKINGHHTRTLAIERNIWESVIINSHNSWIYVKNKRNAHKLIVIYPLLCSGPFFAISRYSRNCRLLHNHNDFHLYRRPSFYRIPSLFNPINKIVFEIRGIAGSRYVVC
jgi:hypothetical protein